MSDIQGALRLTTDPNQGVYPEVLVLLGMLLLLRCDSCVEAQYIMNAYLCFAVGVYRIIPLLCLGMSASSCALLPELTQCLVP